MANLTSVSRVWVRPACSPGERARGRVVPPRGSNWSSMTRGPLSGWNTREWMQSRQRDQPRPVPVWKVRAVRKRFTTRGPQELSGGHRSSFVKGASNKVESTDESSRRFASRTSAATSRSEPPSSAAARSCVTVAQLFDQPISNNYE